MGKQPFKRPETDQAVEETTTTKTAMWVRPATDEPVEVKKKDESVSPGLESDTSALGSTDSSSQSAPQPKPSGKSILSVNDPFGIGETILKQLYSGFGDQVPKATAQAKEVATSAFQAANMEEYIKRNKSKDFQEYVREKEGMGLLDPFNIDKALPKYKEQFIKDAGLEKTAANIAARQPEIVARRKDVEKYVQQQNKESAKTLEGIPQSYEDVHDIAGGAKFITNLATQGLWQIPLVIATKGLSGVAMEAASVYDQQLDELANKNNMTRQEVIDKNLDKPAEGQLYAVMAASLDKASAGGLVDIVKKGGAPVLKKALAVTTETLTEPAQGILEEMGGSKGAGLSQTQAFKDAVTVNVSKRINEALGGMFGSGVITALSPSEQAKVGQTEVKDSGDITKATEVAEKIQESVNNTTNEDITKTDKTEDVAGTSTKVPTTTTNNDAVQEGNNGVPEKNKVDSPAKKTLTDEGYQTSYGDYKERLIAENLGRIRSEDFAQFGDKNQASKIMRMNFFGKNSVPLDVQAQEMSYQFNPNGDGTDISPQDIVDFVIKHQKSPKSARLKNLQKDDILSGERMEQADDVPYTKDQVPELSEIEDIITEDNSNAPNLSDEQLDFYLKDEEITPEKLEQAKKDGLFSGFPYNEDDYAALKKYFDQQGADKGSEGDRTVSQETSGDSTTNSTEEKVVSPPSPDNPLKVAVDLPHITEDTVGVDGKKATSVEPPTTNDSGSTEPSGRQHAILARIENSDTDPAIKRGVKEKGDTYIPKGLNITDKEATDLMELYGEKADGVVKDITNGITPDTRTAMAAQLYKKYRDEGKVDQAVDIAMWQADQSTQAGRAGNAAKLWKMMLQGGEDVIALAIEKEKSKEVGKVTEPVRKELNVAREQIDAQIRAQIEAKVQEGIKERIGRAKLISKEKKKEIGDFFDSLKVAAPKGDKMLSSPIPGLTLLPHVWNGAVEVIKQAVLTGANVANAVKAGLDYINANQKEQVDEKVFTDHMTPLVSKMTPVENIDPEKVDVPKLSGRKKKEFIDEVLKAHNEGKLTDKKFDDLYAKKLGVKELSTEDRGRIRELAKTIAEAEKFEEELKKDFTPENIKKHKEYVKLAKKANQQLQEFATAPNNVWDTLISIMQGNLLSSMSLVSNIFYNVNYQPLRFLSTGVGSIVDASVSKLAKLGLVGKSLEDRTINLAAAQKGYFKGGWNGAMEGLEQLTSGTQADERNLREIQSNFNPARAVERWANKDRTLSQKANDYIEGTIGWEAETMFRLLNLGDKPWKRAAELARAYELGTLKGLNGKELQKFILLPDAESEAEIVKAGHEATFQQTGTAGKKIQSAVTNALNFISQIPIVGGPAKVILKSQLPYIKTPWNLIAETMAFAAPPVTASVGIYKIANGNKREGSILIGKAMVGAMIQAVAYQLFANGLLTGDDDKEKKKRDFQSDKTPPPNSMNVSALNRMLSGGSPETKDNDVWVSYQKMGVTGVLFDNYANTYKERIADTGTMAGGAPDYFADMLLSGPKVGSATLDQTFLQGTSTFIEALRGGSERAQEQWLIKTSEALASIVYPNTLSTLSKASDEFNRDVEDETFAKRLANTYKTKVFFSDSLPPKVSIWGEKIHGNPEGRSKYAFYLFDPSKFKNVDTDDYRYQLYQSYKTDYDGDWLPSMPQRKLKVDGQEKKLTPMEYELFATYVGQTGAALTSGYINSAAWEKDSPDKKKEELKYLYGIGLDEGKKEFLFNTGLNVKKNFSAPLDIKMMKHKLNKLKQKMP